MTVKKLMEILREQPEDARVFVSCDGYNNYSREAGGYDPDEDTHVLEKDGVLFIADSCEVEIYR